MATFPDVIDINKIVSFVLYCIVSYCIVLFCIVLYCMVWYCIVLYCIVLRCIVLCCVVLYCTVLRVGLLYCRSNGVVYALLPYLSDSKFNFSLFEGLTNK